MKFFSSWSEPETESIISFKPNFKWGQPFKTDLSSGSQKVRSYEWHHTEQAVQGRIYPIFSSIISPELSSYDMNFDRIMDMVWTWPIPAPSWENLKPHCKSITN